MKTAIQEVMDEIEMEHNNGVEISQKQLWKMLLKAKETEKQQIIDAWENGYNHGACVNEDNDKYHGTQYYTSRFETNK